MLRRSVVTLMSAGLATACASGGKIHRLEAPGQPAVDVLVEGTEGEDASTPTAVVPAWMLDGSRPGDTALWSIYARVVAEGVKSDPEGLPAADERARAQMAEAASKVGAVKSKYLREDLPRIRAAGFIEEHSRLELEGGGTAVPARADRTIAYIRWRAAELPEMVPETEVGVLAGRRKLDRNTVPWPSVVPALGQFLKFAVDRNDCAAVKSVADIMMPAWTQAKKSGVAYSMDADKRHLDFLKANVKEGQNVGLFPVAYRQAALSSASCLQRQRRHDEALERANLAVEMDPLCSYCWVEKGAAHLGLGDKAAAKSAGDRALNAAVNPGETKAAKEILAAAQ